jgi:uncharacterized protein YigE (DUF2233 family)
LMGRGLLLPVLLLLIFQCRTAWSGSDRDIWKEIEEGLRVAEFSSSPSDDVEYKITVVKLDPRSYALKLISASENGREKMTAREWSQKFNLVAAVNSGMYQEDGLTSVGYMKNFDHVNNPRLGKDKTVLAFNPVGPDVPEVQIIDRECQDFNGLRQKYGTLVQSIRMISCDQENVWRQQAGKWSTVAIGTDEAGKVLLLFCRSPITVHDFVEVLLSLPLSLHRAMYLEGGPQASLYLSTGKTTLERYGSWEPTFEENNPILIPMPIPNVIGIVKKAP